MADFAYVRPFDPKRYVGFAGTVFLVLVFAFFVMELLQSRVLYPGGIFLTEPRSQPLGSVPGYFLHNSSIGLVAWLGGFAVIGPFFMLWENGANIGYYIGRAVWDPTALGYDTTIGAIGFLVPHGIFEIPAILIAIAVGIYNAHLMLDNRLQGVRYDIFAAIREGLPWVLVSLGLFFIAAVVETHISPGFAQQLGEVFG